MRRVLLLSAARTPIARAGGLLQGLSEQELAARAMAETLRRAKLDGGVRIDEVILGVARQTSLPSNCARHAALLAGIPESVPAYTVQRHGASGLQAVLNGFFAIGCGDADFILAGGAESISQVPREIQNARYHFDADTEIVFDPIHNQQICAQPVDRYGKLTPQELSEEMARRYEISLEAQRQYARDSAQRWRGHCTEDVIAPVEVMRKKKPLSVTSDEASLEDTLLPPLGDGAALCALAAEDQAMALDLPVMAELVSAGMGAASPLDSAAAAVGAARQALALAGTATAELDFVEIHELSAAHVLAVAGGLGLTGDGMGKVNPAGGALAQSYPWGAAGAVLVGRAAARIARGEGRVGLVVMPAESGQGLALLMRRWKGEGTV